MERAFVAQPLPAICAALQLLAKGYNELPKSFLLLPHSSAALLRRNRRVRAATRQLALLDSPDTNSSPHPRCLQQAL